MIPERQCYRRLEYDEMDVSDAKQLEALGRIELKQSLTAVRYKEILPDDLDNIYEDGDMTRFKRVLAETIKEFERRISALEEKKG